MSDVMSDMEEAYKLREEFYRNLDTLMEEELTFTDFLYKLKCSCEKCDFDFEEELDAIVKDCV